jgi:hypothetical protein
VVVDSVNQVILPLARAHAGINVYFVAFPFQGRGQLSDVDSHATYSDGMKGLPTKHCDSHKTILKVSVGQAAGEGQDADAPSGHDDYYTFDQPFGREQ